ncbi:MAG: hypothetical protein IJ819_02770 [Clostridiales bacterium]|nr:hypothetical protein [Clostridiales bacterium]
MNIRTKQFQILTDIELVWQLMTDAYNHDTSRLAGLSPLGAERMTGGENEFYRKIGYTDQQTLLHFHK